jgi:hypothetical protein
VRPQRPSAALETLNETMRRLRPDWRDAQQFYEFLERLPPAPTSEAMVPAIPHAQKAARATSRTSGAIALASAGGRPGTPSVAEGTRLRGRLPLPAVGAAPMLAQWAPGARAEQQRFL